MLISWQSINAFIVSSFLAIGLVSCSLTGEEKSLAHAKATMESFLVGKDVKIKQAHYEKELGLYQFILQGNQVVYLDKSLKHFIVGDIFSLDGKYNYTQAAEERAKSMQTVAFDKLPFNRAIKIVKGNGKGKIAIFSDPKCPFCQKLEQQLTEVDNYTAYIFLFPIESLHPGSTKVAEDIWCQGEDKRGAIWHAYMLKHKAVSPAKGCDNPIRANLELGKELDINGTPTLILADGKVISGMPAGSAQLKEILALSK